MSSTHALLRLRTMISVHSLDESGEHRNHHEAFVSFPHADVDVEQYRAVFDVDDYAYWKRYGLSSEFGARIELMAQYGVSSGLRLAPIGYAVLTPASVKALLCQTSEALGPVTTTVTGFSSTALRGREREIAFTITTEPKNREVVVSAVGFRLSPESARHFVHLVRVWKEQQTGCSCGRVERGDD